MKKMLTVMAFVLFALLVAREGTAIPEGPLPTNYSVLHHFDGVDGGWPYGHLIWVDGRLYGMTAGDTIDNKGMVFSIAPDGSGYTRLHHFAGQPTDGAWPHGSLFFQDDTLYGITWAGGSYEDSCPINLDQNGCGTLFSHKTDGTDYNVFWNFTCAGLQEGALPNAHFISDGNRLYSTASAGGSYEPDGSGGTVFAVQPEIVQPEGTGFTVLHSFDWQSEDEGYQPTAGLVLEDGVLYGTTFFGPVPGSGSGFGTVFSIKTDGSGFTTLHYFEGPPDDGASCGSTPILAYGRLFGVTVGGGANESGIIFSMLLDGSDYQVLHHFTVEDSGPMEGVILVEGRLYGATSSTPKSETNGVIYSLRMDGSDYKVLYRFDYPDGPDGCWVDGRLHLVGNRLYGLGARCGINEHGVIFALEEFELNPTVVIDGCDSEVTNILLPKGYSLADEIAMCAESAKNHGKFMSCVSHMTNDLKKDGIITGKEKDAILSCAAKASLP